MLGDVLNGPGFWYYLYFCEHFLFLWGTHYYRPVKPGALQTGGKLIFHRAAAHGQFELHGGQLSFLRLWTISTSCGPNLQEISAVWTDAAMKDKLLCLMLLAWLSPPLCWMINVSSLRGAGAGLFSEHLSSAILFLSYSEGQLKGDQHKLYSPVV